MHYKKQFESRFPLQEAAERLPLFVYNKPYNALYGLYGRFWVFLKGDSINLNAPYFYTYFTPPFLILHLLYTRFYVFFPYICN